MDRRKFTRLCSSLLAGASSLSLSQRDTLAADRDANTGAETNTAANNDGAESQPTNSSIVETVSELVHESGDPVSPDSLAEGRAYVFHYPYRTTPCFLVRLSPSTATAANASAVVLKDKNGDLSVI